MRCFFEAVRLVLLALSAIILLSPGGSNASNAEQPANAQTSERPAASERAKPNILWLFQEDLSPWLGCYGHEVQKGHTPTIDAMAARGVRFSRAFVNSPVCSTCRSGMIVGASQIRFGAHQHRSRRGEAAKLLPEGMKTIPELLTAEGYYCFNIGKTDYNFTHDGIYENPPKSKSKTPWRDRAEGQPFFGQIQLKGGKNNTTKFKNKTDRSKVTIPADYPQNELYREVVAEHYDSARMDDGVIAKIFERLKADGLFENTIIVYLSDHGANNLVRHKQQPTEGGSHVPMIITGPDPYVPAPSVRDDLVSTLDLSATTLSWAGIKLPEYIEGQDLFGVAVKPREFVGTARDRCDSTIERIRSIRTHQFRYTRNYLLDRVLLQPQYRDKRDFLSSLREAYANNTLDPKLAEIYFGERQPEELYDVVKDPAQMNNLVNDPAFKEELDRHRKLMDGWLAKGDMGEEGESDLELKMADVEKWGRGVNAEYERIRSDSDHDGLSDAWETLNGRDPADGKLLFTFDCGGWQTEGWQAKGKLSNIAGRQGFLDFDLLEGSGGIVRDGLKTDPAKNGSELGMRFKADQPTTVGVYINGRLQEEKKFAASDNFQESKTPILILKGSDTYNSIEFRFKSTPGAKVEIDWVKTMGL